MRIRNPVPEAGLLAAQLAPLSLCPLQPRLQLLHLLAASARLGRRLHRWEQKEVIKGIVSRDEYFFFKVLKFETVLFEWALMVFTICEGNPKWNFCFKEPSSESLFRHSDSRLCLLKLFRNPPEILKIVPQAGYECTLEKLANESKGNLNINLMRLSEQLLELVFQKKQAKTSCWFFSRTK